MAYHDDEELDKDLADPALDGADEEEEAPEIDPDLLETDASDDEEEQEWE